MTTLRTADVRFYFDADVLGVAKIIGALRADVTYPGDPGAVVHKRRRPPCPISDPATKDRVWIPEVAKREWLIVTRDSRIQDHRAEIAAVVEHGAKMIALSAREAMSRWDQLEVVMAQWRAIEATAAQPGPYIWRATRSGLNKVKLD